MMGTIDLLLGGVVVERATAGLVIIERPIFGLLGCHAWIRDEGFRLCLVVGL